MLLKTWQFATVMLVALAMGSAFCHLMELPAKMTYEPELYVRLHRTLYPNFGRTAGIAEALGTIAVAGLAWRLRKEPALFRPTLAAAILMAAAHAVFWTRVQPANVTLAGWPLDAIPTDWTSWRNRWEYGHAARAGLMIGSLASLVISLLRRPRAEH